MQQTIDPRNQTVLSCLSKSYYIDFYQREYVWNTATVHTLLNDIFYAFELSYDLYKDAEMTQEVLNKFNWYYLNIFITNDINGKVYVVDGQQRLSTLTLIATKLFHTTQDNNRKKILERCIHNYDMFKGNIYLLDNDKRKDAMDALLKSIPFDREYRNKTEQTLIERYDDISKYIDGLSMDTKKLDAFILYFLNRLVLVELGITQNDTPMIFEVINDRGEALKPFEILKGKLVGALDKNDTDKYSSIWDNAINRVNEIENDFFIDYLKSHYIFKRNAKIESAINNSYHRFIFEADNDAANDLKLRRTDKGYIDNIKSFLSRNVDYYTNLYAKIRNNTLKDDNITYLEKILSLSGHYQIIMAACKHNDPEEDEKIHIIAKEYERLYMLLTLNSVYDSNSFQEISYDLNDKLSSAPLSDYRKIFDEKIIEAIKERRNQGVVNSTLEYGAFTRTGYSTISTRVLRYFLARVEKYLCDGTGQDMKNDVLYIATKTGAKTGYHIEHILSHNDTNLGYFANEDEFEDQRNKLGGLLLLLGIDNISSSNEEYVDKLKTYSVGLVWGHTLCEDFYHTNKNMAAFNAGFKQQSQMEIHSISVFDKDALNERTSLLYQLVKLIWEV